MRSVGPNKDASLNFQRETQRILKTYSAPIVTILTPEQVRALLGDNGKQPAQQELNLPSNSKTTL